MKINDDPFGHELWRAIEGVLGLEGRSVRRLALTLEVGHSPKVEVEEYVINAKDAEPVRTALIKYTLVSSESDDNG